MYKTTGALSHYIQKELIRPTQIPAAEKNALICDVPIGLINRNIYLYLEAKFTGASAQYTLGGEIEVYLEGIPRGRFPASIATINLLTGQNSVATILNGGGSAVGNSLAIKLASPFAVTQPDVAVTDAVLQPFQIQAEISRVVFHLDSASPGTSTFAGWRAFLAVMSFGSL